MQRAAELNDRSVKTFVNLARIQNDRGEFESALQSSDAALALDGQDPSALFLRGRSLNNLGRTEPAIEALEQSLALDADNGYVHNLLGLIYLGQGDVDRAVPVLTRAAESVPGVAYVHNNLGMALELSDRPFEAISAYARAAQLDPQHEKATLNLARMNARHPDVPAEIPPGVEDEPRVASIADGQVPSTRTDSGHPE